MDPAFLAQLPANDVSIADIFTSFAGYGLLGILTFMIIFRVKIQPTYVQEGLEKEWEKEKASLTAAWAAEKITLTEKHDETIRILLENRRRERDTMIETHKEESRVHEVNRTRERDRLEADNASLKADLKESTALYAKDVIPMMSTLAVRMESWLDIINKIDPRNGGGFNG